MNTSIGASKRFLFTPILLASFWLLAFTPATSAQHKKYLAFELAGSGGFASINYESVFLNKGKVDLVWRAGLSFVPTDKNNGSVFIFPVLVHGVFGAGKNKLDLGLGQTFSVTTKGNIFLRMPLSLGYRFQPNDKNYYWRLSYTPIISYLFDWQWQHWGGLTFGYALKSK